MEIGKLPTEILEKLLNETVHHSMVNRKEIILRPNIGEDCSALDLGNELCLLSTDPITAATNDIGSLAVHINANDIFSSGGEVVAILVTILLPPTSTETELEVIMKDIATTCQKLNIEIAGGHTEITDAVNRPIISCTVIGKTNNRKMIKTSGAQIGQGVIMTKWAGLEGTSILAKEYYYHLAKFFSKEDLMEAQALDQYLSILEEAKICFDFGATSMHDVTEGGIYGACYEMAKCSGVGIEVYEEKIKVKGITKKMCHHFKINPYQLISSGCLLISSFNENQLVEILNQNGIEASVIGKIVEDKKIIISQSQIISLEEPQSDEIYKIKYVD